MNIFSLVFKTWLTPRNAYLGSVLLCVGLLVGAVIISSVVVLVPCPLCVAQRIFFGLAGLAALAGYALWSRNFDAWVASGLMLICSLLGGAIALRQVWMQHFPPAGFDPTTCSVSFGSFVDNFLKALGGAGNCAVRDFTLLGLALPEWSLLCFVGLAFVSTWLLAANFKRAE